MGAAIADHRSKTHAKRHFAAVFVDAFYSQTSRSGSGERNFHPMRRSSLLWMRILTTSRRDQKIEHRWTKCP